MSKHFLISEDDFDGELAGGNDPLAKIPAGFPSMHARYQVTPPRRTDIPSTEIPADQDAKRLSAQSIAEWHRRIRRLLDDVAIDQDHSESFED